jgi:superfamily II DNA or RNA helicase
LLRRTRREVLPELPKRTDQIFRVRLTTEQAGPYSEQNEILGKLMSKWQRQGWLSELDLRRISCCIQNMRMLCNSTFLFDKRTNFSPKLEEFGEIIRELAIEEKRKVVVFSEYERMTYLAGRELTRLGIGWVSLHGGVPARKRGELITRFGKDPDCRVFLSTDAGGVGLNLQAGSAVVIFEPPWNPARLEQRIGRVHRLGQTQPVQVIHLLTEDSIEERVWETLRLKKALFEGIFDSTSDEVNFAKLGRKSVMQVIKDVFCDQPGRPKPIVTQGLPERIAVTGAERNRGPATKSGSANGRSATMKSELREARTIPVAESVTQDTGSHSRSTPPDAGQAVAKFLEAGLNLLESLSPPPSPGNLGATERFGPIRRGLHTLLRTDSQTKRQSLDIPLPESISVERLERVIDGFLGNLARSS